MSGIECPSEEIAGQVVQSAYKKGLIIETCGNRDQIVKCFAPLTISNEELERGLNLLEKAFSEVTSNIATAAAS